MCQSQTDVAFRVQQLANAGECNRGYLIAQPRGALQQGLPGVLVDDQPPDLWGDGLFGWRLRIAASSRRAPLTGERWRQTFGSGRGAGRPFHITLIVQSNRGASLTQTAALARLKYRFPN